MPDPITTVGLGAVAAYLGKDGLNKMLGPTADYLGESLRDFAQKRAQNVGKIFGNAEKKLGKKIEQPGQIPPKVLKTILNEGSYSDDEIAVEYFGGILASSRTEQGRDDRGARIGKILDSLSVYQIRTHYIVYTLIRKIFKDSGYKFSENDRSLMQIFIPWDVYTKAMEFSQSEMNQVSSILSHSFFGLNADNLIETFNYGPEQAVKKISANIKGGGIVVTPSAFGAELYLWGYGQGDKDLAFILKDDEFTDMQGLPIIMKGVIPSDEQHIKSMHLTDWIKGHGEISREISRIIGVRVKTRYKTLKSGFKLKNINVKKHWIFTLTPNILKNDLDEYNNALAKLEDYLNGNASNLTDSDARIYHFYIQERHNYFEEIAKEVDDDYRKDV